eukprot:8165134-Pyramimonas_sp.AAC.1
MCETAVGQEGALHKRYLSRQLTGPRFLPSSFPTASPSAFRIFRRRSRSTSILSSSSLTTSSPQSISIGFDALPTTLRLPGASVLTGVASSNMLGRSVAGVAMS